MDFINILLGSKVKGYSSLYRMIAILGGGIVFIESVLWSILCLISMIYYFWGGPHSEKYENLMTPFGYVLSVIYYRRRTFDTCANITAVCLFIFSLGYFFLSAYLIYVSILLLFAVGQWDDPITIRRRCTNWIIAVLVMSVLEFCTSLAFFTEFVTCSDQEQYSIAAAALLLSALFLKGFILWALNIGFSISMFCMQYCEYNVCPV